MAINLEPQQRRMLQIERLRNALVSPLPASAGGNGVLFLVAISYFEFGSHLKGFFAGSMHYGMMAGLFLLPLLSRLQLPINKAMAGLLLLSGIGLLCAAASSSGAVYVVAVMLSICCMMLTAPMVTGLWSQQMPATIRGRLFSQISLIMMLANFAFAGAAAWYIGDEIGRFRPVVVYLGLAMTCASLFAWRLPAQRLIANRQNPLSLLGLLWKDRLFGYISMTWMLLGLGNLATIPLRAEHLIELDYNPDWVLVIIAVVPAAGSIASTMVWGRLFDRMNFIVLRISINLCFCLSIVLFFREAFYLQIIGSLLFGIGQGGGNVAWNLWVTKYSPPDRISDYQTVHAFLTGCRGVGGPLAAYAMYNAWSMGSVVWLCAGLIAVSCVLLLPVIRYGRR